jgi:hypothetical protein
MLAIATPGEPVAMEIQLLACVLPQLSGIATRSGMVSGAARVRRPPWAHYW